MEPVPPEPRSAQPAPPFASTPPVVLWLVGAIAVAHFARTLLPAEWQDALLVHFAVVPAFLTTQDSPYEGVFGRAIPFLAHAFLHANFIHLVFNSLAILDIGAGLTRTQGSLRFLLVFFVSAVAGGAVFVLLNPHLEAPVVGASGAACGLFGALAGGALLRAEDAHERKKLIWRSIFWFLFLNVGLAAMVRITNTFPIAWEAHLGGFLAGVALTLVLPPPRPKQPSPVN